MADSSATKSIGEINREHFNSIADSIYDEKWIQNLVKELTSYLHDNVDWMGLPNQPNRRMLDYACGGGLASLAISQHFSTLRGIDVSEGMVSLYNRSGAAAGLSPTQMRAVRGDLAVEPLEDPLDDPDLAGFHLIVMSMALHHVDNQATLIRRLADRLVPGGVLVIIDGVRPEAGGQWPEGHDEDGEEHPAAKTTTRHGFDEEEVKAMFEGAALGDWRWALHPRKIPIPAKHGIGMQLFYARGRAPETKE